MTSVEQWEADRRVIRAMLKFGGGFAVCLGEAALHADKDNLDRIKKAWPEYWSKYTEMAKSMKEEP